MSWITALTVLYPDLSDVVTLELSELEVQALAHIRGVKVEVVTKYAKISNDKITISDTQWTFKYDLERLKKEIKAIEKAGGDHYSFLTIQQAKDLLAKLILAAK